MRRGRNWYNWLMMTAMAISTLTACQQNAPAEEAIEHGTGPIDSSKAGLTGPNETHLHNLRQLTFGGNNAEAYWSPDGRSITFQSDFADWGVQCDQIFSWNMDEGPITHRPQLISTGQGRTTCSYFVNGGQRILYASTHLGSAACPPTPPHGGVYTWPIYSTFDIFVANRQGKIEKQLTDRQGYDAEATVSPKGDRIVFTSTRSGDLELWTMDTAGGSLKQITSGLGYDGGAFYSPDGTMLVYRASRPQGDSAKAAYLDLLHRDLVQPTEMEIWVCNADGSNQRQVTKLGKANWAPFFTPDGKRILFASNHASTRGYDFQLYLINLDGTGLEQVTTESNFNAFPMFSPSGKQLIFSSNRNNGGTHDTNLFLADWTE